MLKEKNTNSTVPTSTKPCQYSLSARQKVNEKKNENKQNK